MSQPASTTEIAPDDRLPSFAEVDAFDANTAWDRLSPIEQRRVGILAVRLGVVGQRLNFEHSDWTHQQVRLMEVRESDELEAFNDALEPLWARLFGWIAPAPCPVSLHQSMTKNGTSADLAPRWAKPVIRQVV